MSGLKKSEWVGCDIGRQPTCSASVQMFHMRYIKLTPETHAAEITKIRRKQRTIKKKGFDAFQLKQYFSYLKSTATNMVFV